MKAVILSAGLGTRLRPLTNDKPKVMVKVGGKPVLEHLINLCKYHNIIDIIINLHYFPKSVINYFSNGQKFGVNIEYSLEKDQIMGGAGALKKAEKLLKESPFLVMNGDALMNINLTKMIAFHNKKKGIGTILVHKTDHPYDSDLVEYDRNYLIKRFFRPDNKEKYKSISKSGVHIFEPEVLNDIPINTFCSLEKKLIPDLLMKDKKLYAYYSKAYSKDMGTPERLVQVKQDYENGKILF